MTGDHVAKVASVASMLADIHTAPLKHIRAGMRDSQNPPIYLSERPRDFLLDWCRDELSLTGLRAVWEHVRGAEVSHG